MWGMIAYYVAFWSVAGIIISLQKDKVGQAETEIRMAVYRNNSNQAVETLRNAPQTLGLSHQEYERLVANVTEFAKEYKKDVTYDLSQVFHRYKQQDYSRQESHNPEQSLTEVLDDKMSQRAEGKEPTAQNISAKSTEGLNEEVNELLLKWFNMLKSNPHLTRLDQIPLIKFLEIRKAQVKRIEAGSSIINKQEYIQKVEEEILQCIESWNTFKKFCQDNEKKKMILLSNQQRSTDQN